MRPRRAEGRFAQRELHGIDDAGREELLQFWIERRAGALWVVGRSVNAHLRQSDEPRPEDVLFEGYELEEALTRANEALEDDLSVLEGDGAAADGVRPFTRKEVLPLLERFFFGR